ncbi:MAG: SDR family oxidoreductase [SAR324 cluster bacterium]|jgi:NAD(P)-dependent dehydrogenase (short-subunit alcohol dehydrogenase family)|nr:SDR family oxidoreductase [SAR324 cluster bacterium]
MNTNHKPVAIVVGATSKWQSDGRNTRLVHGKELDDSDLPVGVRWGVGGAIAQKFAQEGFFVVLTTRSTTNATLLDKAIKGQGGESMIVELDLTSSESIANAFTQIRAQAGDPEVLVYNAGYLEGRDLPREKELLEHIPVEVFETAQHICSRGPFLVAKEVLPAMRERGEGSFLISNNIASLRGRKRMTGESLYYPRVMMRQLVQVLTEEYSEFGVHVANVVIDGTIDSPGTRALTRSQPNPDLVSPQRSGGSYPLRSDALINPVKIAEAFYYLHTQDKSAWTHELQLTPFLIKPGF